MFGNLETGFLHGGSRSCRSPFRSILQSGGRSAGHRAEPDSARDLESRKENNEDDRGNQTADRRLRLEPRRRPHRLSHGRRAASLARSDGTLVTELARTKRQSSTATRPHGGPAQRLQWTRDGRAIVFPDGTKLEVRRAARQTGRTAHCRSTSEWLSLKPRSPPTSSAPSACAKSAWRSIWSKAGARASRGPGKWRPAKISTGLTGVRTQNGWSWDTTRVTGSWCGWTIPQSLRRRPWPVTAVAFRPCLPPTASGLQAAAGTGSSRFGDWTAASSERLLDPITPSITCGGARTRSTCS